MTASVSRVSKPGTVAEDTQALAVGPPARPFLVLCVPNPDRALGTSRESPKDVEDEEERARENRRKVKLGTQSGG